jgi:hypothetical protein
MLAFVLIVVFIVFAFACWQQYREWRASNDKRTALLRLPTLAMVLVAGFGWPSHEAQAQQAQPGSITTYRATRGPVVGGYSTTLDQVWGAPKMPATPKDFGPHFDFPAGGSQVLTCGSPGSTYYCGGLSDSPYPN